MATTTAQPETKLPAEYRIVDGVQILQIIGTNAEIYVIPKGKTGIDVKQDEFFTVIYGTIKHEKNQFVPNTSFLVHEGSVCLSCDEPASFRRGD